MPETIVAPTEEGASVKSAVVARELAVSYPESDPVLDCARLDLPRGAVTAIIGPNGSGKSTLLDVLARHIDPDAGTVRFDGASVDSFDRAEFARQVGLLSQESDAPDSLSVGELVAHGRFPYRGHFESLDDADRAAIDRALSLAGVKHLRSEPIGQLSGGQKQLAWTAMVLAQEPDVLLLDEPTTYLDLHHQLRVLETVRTLNERDDRTVAVVLHDISQAARFADYLVALSDGTIYDWGPPDEVLTEQLLADVFGVAATVDREPDIQIRPSHALSGRE